MKLPFTRFRPMSCLDNKDLDELMAGHNLPLPRSFIKVSEQFLELNPHKDPEVDSQFTIFEGQFVVVLTYPKNSNYYDEEGFLLGYVKHIYDLQTALETNLVKEID